ncbi:GNAT family N-acetyltransferase [Acetobacter pasteurianus]|uniref:N-acetyltransferase domain-containing protein n=3 Tax=Acetobacter pasteurianus TaxID=438 RepID=A0A401WTS6_ACEPA|nr:GNAT family N-acetyltransferase [Acetobacter pasteurianus]GCD49871.1 hypothetical protein NBRC106471_1427 [Acetobacter pasteurianus subsp. pasteurianus LMG 1262 = NBRC 106471]GCD52741.1 hypothetical protein NBRC3188_1438 [Acetobacter pasteurianus NBRC 3188]
MCNLVDNTAEHRFELMQNGQKTFVDYANRDGVLVLLHTEVPASLKGQGAGSRLARAVLDAARSRKVKISIKCDFLLHFISNHPEYRDIISL